MAKKIIVGAGILAMLAVAVLVNAQTATTTATSLIHPIASQRNMVQIGPQGKALIRGTIASVSGSALTVNSWGGVWTVNVSSGAEILPTTIGKDITQFKAGDFVGVQGSISQSASWTVDATLVRDWTYRQALNQEQKQNVNSARQTMKGETPKNFVGTATNVNGSSFTLTVGGTAYTVNVAGGAEVINRNWATLPIASIQSGNSVRVWGVNTGGTISAQIVRDISIPATATPANH
jgi:hypothetical protein